jgi:hypothetical protein
MTFCTHRCFLFNREAPTHFNVEESRLQRFAWFRRKQELLSLPKTKSGRIDGATRPGSAARLCLQSLDRARAGGILSKRKVGAHLVIVNDFITTPKKPKVERID